MCKKKLLNYNVFPKGPKTKRKSFENMYVCMYACMHVVPESPRGRRGGYESKMEMSQSCKRLGRKSW